MARIDEIMAQNDKFALWIHVLLFGLASTCIGPVLYDARPVDLPRIFVFGSLLGFMQPILAKNPELYAHVFEISIAILTAFIARALGSYSRGKQTFLLLGHMSSTPSDDAARFYHHK